MMFSKTIQAVRRREALAEDVDWDLYKWVEGHPGLNIYELAKSISWSRARRQSSRRVDRPVAGLMWP